VTPLLAPGERVNQAIFSPDGRHVATLSQDGPVRLFDVQAAREVFATHANPARWIAFDPGGTQLVIAGGDGAAYVWNLATGSAVFAPLRHRAAVNHAEFNHDGTLIVTASEDSTARIWKAATGEIVMPPLKHDGAVRRAVFSPDGRKLATTCSARGRAGDYAQLWDTANGQRVTPLLHHDAGVTDVVFSPDGRRLATGCADGSARIWDTGTGQALTPPLRHPTVVKQVGFSPDGRRLAGASEDGTLVIWDAVTGELASTRLTHPVRYDVARFDFSRDGRRLAIATAAEAVWIRELTKTERSVDDLIEEAQVLSAHRIDPVAGIAPLDSATQSNVWQRYQNRLKLKPGLQQQTRNP
jgi:WD40 repeat protein